MYKVECISFGRYTQAGSLNFVREDYLIMWILEGSSFPPPCSLARFAVSLVGSLLGKKSSRDCNCRLQTNGDWKQSLEDWRLETGSSRIKRENGLKKV